MIMRVKGSVIRELDLGGYINLGDLCNGDGVTDVTAIVAAALATGYALFVPAGVFLITSLSIPADATVFGIGIESEFKVKDLANSVTLSAGARCILEDFAINGNKLNQVGTNFHGVQVSAVDGVTLSRLNIRNTKGDGINLTGANTNTKIKDCYVTGFTENGIKVAQGLDISIIDCSAITSDPAATGDGIALSSNGNTVNQVQIIGPVSKGNAGRGISLLGNGSKNVTNVTITNPRVTNNVGNGIHFINVDGATIQGGLSATNGIDGVRIEGDVQNCRIVTVATKSNVSFGIREVVSGSTPNFNGLIYGICSGNGNNVITKVGASSYIV